MAKADKPDRSSVKPQSARSTAAPITRKLDAEQLEKLTALIKSYRGTNADLAKAAKLAPSTVSMIFSGVRAPSVKVTARLAKALCPPDRSLEAFTEEMLELVGYERTAADNIGASETRCERIERTKKIKAAYVLSDPFVNSQGKGFAAELFGYVADLMKAKVNPVDCDISRLREVLESGEADIAVSAILPTFERRSYMSFSKPFPYLRVPLSALIRKGTSIGEGRPLTVEHVLNWNITNDGLGRVKILLVEGEVGHDFVKTFLTNVQPKNYELMRTLAPEELYRRISADPNPDLLFLADMATCAAVHELAKAKGEIQPLPDTSPVAKHIQSVLGHSQFPVLALYPITFGLPKGDEDWKDTIDMALDSLMSEGARIILSLYHRYLETEKFMDFCIGDDELVTSKPLQQMFQDLSQKGDKKISKRNKASKKKANGRSQR